MTAVMARHHVTTTIPTPLHPGGMRVVLTEGGEPLRSLVAWFQVGRNLHQSIAWQTKVARSVGLLYDWYVAVPPAPGAERRYLSDFVQALLTGTVQRDGADPTGLYWRRLSWTQVERVIRDVTAFSDFCAEEAGVEPLNPRVAPSFSDRLSIHRRFDAQNAHSLFKHLGNAKAKAREIARGAPEVRGPDVPKVVPADTAVYPRDRFADLLEHGFRRRVRGAPWETHNIRDMMIAILQRHGGLRVSEPFHLFVGDVQENPHARGHALVRLFHPRLGGVDWLDPVKQRVETVQRDEYLERKWGRLPRSLMSGSQRAGWKKLRLEVGAPSWSVPVYWWPREWGAEFWRLYCLYRDHVLPHGMSHPYLFVSLDDENTGQPLTIKAYADSLARANARIGLSTSKAAGTTSHGFRHAYAQDLTDAQMPAEVIQACLHHASREAQEIYTRAQLAAIRRGLDEGERRLRAGATPAPYVPPPSLAPALGLPAGNVTLSPGPSAPGRHPNR